MRLVLAAALTLVLASACAHSQPPTTHAQLAARCALTPIQLDSVLDSSATHAREVRGVDVTSAIIAVALSTTLPGKGHVDCRSRAHILGRTIMQ